MKFGSNAHNNLTYNDITMKRRKRLYGQIALLVIGILLISVGLVVFIYFEAIYDAILNNALQFNPTSQAFRVWRKNDPPLDMDLYVFNWTNPEDIRNPSIKPIFQEVGPYRFKEVKEKVNITWNDNNTISYMHKKSYYYDARNSVRNLSDIVTTINAVPLTIGFKARNFGYFSKKILSMSLSSISSLSVTKTAGEILFDGYEENILKILSMFPLLNVKDKFGIFYGKNGTVGLDGSFSMYTGNNKNFGRIMSWNFKSRSNFYNGHCNDIRGSAGEFYPINRKRDKIVLYSSELCKMAELEYEKDLTIKGVHGYKFSARNIFDNGTTKPENACFCTGECVPSGTLNVSACREDSPTFLSMPHFFGGDPYYINSMRGLNPQEDKHEFYMIIEPKSGIIMEAAARMQINMLLQPVRYIGLYEDVPKIFVPLFYFDQKINLTDELAANLRMIQNLPEYANYLELILLCLGTISILWSVCLLYCCSKSKYADTYKCPQNTHIPEEIPLNQAERMNVKFAPSDTQ